MEVSYFVVVDLMLKLYDKKMFYILALYPTLYKYKSIKKPHSGVHRLKVYSLCQIPLALCPSLVKIA